MSPTYALITAAAPAIARSGAGDSDTIMLYVTGLGWPDVVGASTGFAANCITGANYLAAVNGTIPANSALASDDGLVMQSSLIPSLPPCLSSANPASPDLPTVKIGGVATPAVGYAGWVGGAVAGLYQINVQLPTSTAINAFSAGSVGSSAAPLPIVITSNTVTSQSTGVTLSVIEGLLGTVTGSTSGPTGAKANPVYVYTGAKGSAVSGSLAVVGTEGGGSPTYTYVIDASSPLPALPGALVLNADGTITGTPGNGGAGLGQEVIFLITDTSTGLVGNVTIIFNFS